VTDPEALLRIAADAAAEAGRLLASWRGEERPQVIRTKSSPTDVVTEMDRRSEALITERIRPVISASDRRSISVTTSVGLDLVSTTCGRSSPRHEASSPPASAATSTAIRSRTPGSVTGPRRSSLPGNPGPPRP
jgi:hypothetical protein